MNEDENDRKLTLKLFIVLAVFVIIVGGALLGLASFYTAEGLTVIGAMPYSFILTIITLVILAFAAGDGLLGEIQYMILGFAGFFVSLTFLIALVF